MDKVTNISIKNTSKPITEKQVRDGDYLFLQDVPVKYPVFSIRLLRRLVQERRIPFSKAGRAIVFSTNDIEDYLEQNRVVPEHWLAS